MEVIQGVTTDVVLKFNHLMHKIVVKLKADGTTVTEEDLSKAKISIYNFRPTAVIDLLSAEVKGASGRWLDWNPQALNRPSFCHRKP